MKIKTLFGLLIIAVTLGVSLIGCSKVRLTKKTAGAMVQKELHRKYGIETEIEGVQWVDGAYGLAQPSYEFELHVKGEKSKKFTASVTVSGDRCVDDYSKLIYQPGFEKMVQEQIDKLIRYPSELQFNYLRIEENYTKPEDWKKYLRKSDVGVRVKLTAPSDATHEEIAKKVALFLQKICKEGFFISIYVYQDEKEILFVANSWDSERISYKEILGSFE